MLRALILLIFFFWPSLAVATEVYVCEAASEYEFAGQAMSQQYELRLVIKDKGGGLTTFRDESNFEIIKDYVEPVSGSLSIVDKQVIDGLTMKTEEMKISGFATRNPG